MQHIINVAFDFDDQRITESIENQVEQQVVHNITEEVKHLIFEKRWGNNYNENNPTPLRRMIEDQIAIILDEHKAEITNNASKMLSGKLLEANQ